MKYMCFCFLFNLNFYFLLEYLFNSVQLLSHGQLFVTLWTASCQAFLSITNSRSLLKLMAIESVMPPNQEDVCLPCPQSFPTSGSFSMSQLFTSSDRSIGASTWVLPMNIQGWLPLGLTGLISLPGLRLSIFPSTTVWKKHQFMVLSVLYGLFSHPYMTTGKTIALIIWTFVRKIMSLLFNTLSRFVIVFLPRSKK